MLISGPVINAEDLAKATPGIAKPVKEVAKVCHGEDGIADTGVRGLYGDRNRNRPIAQALQNPVMVVASRNSMRAALSSSRLAETADPQELFLEGAKEAFDTSVGLSRQLRLMQAV